MDICHLKRVKAQMRLQKSWRSIGQQLFRGLEKFCRHSTGREKTEIATVRFARFIFGNCGSEFAKILPPAQTHGDIQDRALLRLHELGGGALRCSQKNVSGANSYWLHEFG